MTVEHTHSELVPVTEDQQRKARKVAYWLRRCGEEAIEIDCYGCPFADSELNCIDEMQETAADLLEELAGIRSKKQRRTKQ